MTRWVAHKEKTYYNHLKTLVAQGLILQKSDVKKKSRNALAAELLHIVNVALIIVATTVLKQLRKLSVYGQSRNKASWTYPKMAISVVRELK